MRASLRRRPFYLLLPLAILACSFSGTERADADGTRHPYFNDRGTLRWHHTLASAKRTALREGKLIFVEYGRKRCSNGKKLAERMLPHSSIRGRLSSVAIGLAAECDTPEREVQAMFRQHLPRARSLPFVAFLTPRGRWITGWAGYAKLGQVSAQLSTAEATHAQLMRARHSRQRAATASRTRRPAAPQSTKREPAPRPAAPATKRAAAPGAKPAAAPPPPPPPPPATPTPARDPHEDEGLDEDPCADGGCEDGSCDYNPCEPGGKPAFRFANLFGSDCKSRKPESARPTAALPKTTPPARCKTAAPGVQTPSVKAPRVASAESPTPTVRVEKPKRVLAVGSPDGFPEPAQRPVLRAPAVVERPAAKKTTAALPAGTTRAERQAIASAAAAQGDWAKVLRYTRGASRDDEPRLYELNHQAHSWAHGLLASAVRSIRDRRFAEAHQAVHAVQTTMRGQPEAIDAERGAEAIELMRDIEPLAEKSLVRRTVRKTAYEKMRGTRWAPLFSPVPQPGAAVATK
ncbi:MAG: hypothetical protein P1V36_09870 [Planctomycetota bacterium]|nr:hypothetical protein [Planctomycetota bacterium]